MDSSPLPRAPGGDGSPMAVRPAVASSRGIGSSPTSATPSGTLGGISGTAGGLGSSAKNVTVERKVQKLLEITFNESMKESLDELDRSGFDCSRDNTPKQRKQLKSSLEHRVLALHETFLHRFTKTRQAYKEVAARIETISECCDSVQSALEANREARISVLSNVDLLREELAEAQKKEAQVKEFMEKYQLTPEDHATLKGEVTPAFLQVLMKTKKIHDSCQNMLSMEHQQAAVEVMEAMYLTQVSATEKLTRHLVPMTSEILCHDTPTVTQFYVDAVKAIQDKPGQWAKVIHEVSRVRRIAVLRRFYDVMNQATNGQELTVTEAPRFIGEVLAWVHQCIAEESDTLSFFFADQEPKKRNGTTTGATEASSVLNIMDSHTITQASVLDQIFEGLCKHLGDRIDSMLDGVAAFTSTGTANGSSSSSSGPRSGGGLLLGSRSSEATLGSVLVSLFKMEGLLRFYSDVTSKLMTNKAALCSLLQTRRLNCLRLFFDSLQLLAKSMLSARSMSSDYSVPMSLMEVFQTLTSMLESLQGSTVPHSEREVEFAPILSAIADPLPQLIDSVFTEVTESAILPLNAGDGKLVFKINVFSGLRSCIAPFSFTTARQMKLATIIDKHTDELVSSSTTQLLKRLGFEDYIEPLIDTETGAIHGFAAKDGRIASQSLRTVLLSFYTYVFGASGTLNIPLLESISAYPVRESVRSLTTTNVCAAYDKLYELAMKDAVVSKDANVSKNTPRQIRVLLEASPAADQPASEMEPAM